MNIKVTVDYANGCYNVTGVRDGKTYTLNKPIRGTDDSIKLYVENYSRTSMEEKRRSINSEITSMMITRREVPRGAVNRSAARQVDPVLYAALRDWDRLNQGRSNYAREYLAAIVQERRSEDGNRISRAEAREAIQADLRNAGIDIKYNVALVNTDKRLSFFDKIKGIIMAYRQRRLFGTEVHSGFRLQESMYESDVEAIDKMVKGEISDEDFDRIHEIFDKESERPEEASRDQAETRDEFDELGVSGERKDAADSKGKSDDSQSDHIWWGTGTKKTNPTQQSVQPKQPTQPQQPVQPQQPTQPQRRRTEIVSDIVQFDTAQPTKTDGTSKPKKTIKGAKTIEFSTRLTGRKTRRQRIQERKKKERSVTPMERNAKLTAEKKAKWEQFEKGKKESAEKAKAAEEAEKAKAEAEAEEKANAEAARKAAEDKAKADAEEKANAEAARKAAEEKDIEEKVRQISEAIAAQTAREATRAKREEIRRKEQEQKAGRPVDSRSEESRRPSNRNKDTRRQVDRSESTRSRIVDRPAKHSEEARRQFEDGKFAKAVSAFTGAVIAAAGRFKGKFSSKLVSSKPKDREIDDDWDSFIFDYTSDGKDDGKTDGTSKPKRRRPVRDVRPATPAKAETKPETKPVKVEPRAESKKKEDKTKPEKAKKKTLGLNIKDSLNKTKIGRRINAGVRHYKRKLRSAKESIKNFKFKPKEKFKKIVIVGAVGLLAAGAIFFSAKTIGNYNEFANSTGGDTSYSTEGSAPSQDVEFVNPLPDGTGTEQTETGTGTEQTETGTETEKPGTETGTEQDNHGTETDKPGTGTGTEQDDHGTENEQPGTKPGGTEADKPGGAEQPGTTETEKTDAEKLEEFRQEATEKYMEEFVIGEKPEVGDMLQDKVYWENPDGTGKFGYFESHPDYKISHINIVEEKGWTVVRVDGRSLTELLAEYPDCIDYNVAFVNSKTGGGLGFVTKAQLESMIKDKVDSIIQSRTVQNNPTQNQENPDIER